MPAIKRSFQDVRCLTFYRLLGGQVCAYWLPRLFARQGIIIAQKKQA